MQLFYKVLLSFFSAVSLLAQDLTQIDLPDAGSLKEASELLEEKNEADFLPFSAENSLKMGEYGALPNLPGSLDAQTAEPPFAAPPLPKPYRSGHLAAGLSLIYPGLGHLYLGDNRAAAVLSSTMGASIGAGLGWESWMKAQREKDGEFGFFFNPGFILAQATWGYGIFAAYRDGRAYNQFSGYNYPMPTDSFSDLAYAPFRSQVMKKPEVWGGVLGALVIGTVVSYFGFSSEEVEEAQPGQANATRSFLPLAAFPVGLGEEALFRGCIQPLFSEALTPWGGLTLASLAFGAAHIPNALMLPEEDRWRYYSFSLPLITGIGAYCGWLSMKNRSLQESVALHAWYDFVLFGLTALTARVGGGGASSMAICVPF